MLEIKIVLADDGSVNVTGPIENTILMLGALETAKVIVTRMIGKNAPRVVTPEPGFRLVNGERPKL